MAAHREQLVGGHRPPGASGIEFGFGQGPLAPALADWVDDGPGNFDFIAADERVECVMVPIRDGVTIVRKR